MPTVKELQIAIAADVDSFEKDLATFDRMLVWLALVMDVNNPDFWLGQPAKLPARSTWRVKPFRAQGNKYAE